MASGAPVGVAPPGGVAGGVAPPPVGVTAPPGGVAGPPDDVAGPLAGPPGGVAGPPGGVAGTPVDVGVAGTAVDVGMGGPVDVGMACGQDEEDEIDDEDVKDDGRDTDSGAAALAPGTSASPSSSRANIRSLLASIGACSTTQSASRALVVELLCCVIQEQELQMGDMVELLKAPFLSRAFNLLELSQDERDVEAIGLLTTLKAVNKKTQAHSEIHSTCQGLLALLANARSPALQARSVAAQSDRPEPAAQPDRPATAQSDLPDTANKNRHENSPSWLGRLMQACANEDVAARSTAVSLLWDIVVAWVKPLHSSDADMSTSQSRLSGTALSQRLVDVLFAVLPSTLDPMDGVSQCAHRLVRLCLVTLAGVVSPDFDEASDLALPPAQQSAFEQQCQPVLERILLPLTKMLTNQHSPPFKQAKGWRTLRAIGLCPLAGVARCLLPHLSEVLEVASRRLREAGQSEGGSGDAVRQFCRCLRCFVPPEWLQAYWNKECRLADKQWDWFSRHDLDCFLGAALVLEEALGARVCECANQSCCSDSDCAHRQTFAHKFEVTLMSLEKVSAQTVLADACPLSQAARGQSYTSGTRKDSVAWCGLLSTICNCMKLPLFFEGLVNSMLYEPRTDGMKSMQKRADSFVTTTHALLRLLVAFLGSTVLEGNPAQKSAAVHASTEIMLSCLRFGPTSKPPFEIPWVDERTPTLAHHCLDLVAFSLLAQKRSNAGVALLMAQHAELSLFELALKHDQELACGLVSSVRNVMKLGASGENWKRNHDSPFMARYLIAVLPEACFANNLDNLLPSILPLVDDHRIPFKSLGLQSLLRVIEQTPTTNLQWHCFIIMASVARSLAFREREALPYCSECAAQLIIALYPQELIIGNTQLAQEKRQVKERCHDLFEKLLGEMEYCTLSPTSDNLQNSLTLLACLTRCWLALGMKSLRYCQRLLAVTLHLVTQKHQALREQALLSVATAIMVLEERVDAHAGKIFEALCKCYVRFRNDEFTCGLVRSVMWQLAASTPHRKVQDMLSAVKDLGLDGLVLG